MSSCRHLNNVLGCGHKPWQSWPWCGRPSAHREESGVRVRVCVSASVSRTNQSRSSLSTHGPKKQGWRDRDAQNSECGPRPGCLVRGPCPGLGQSSTWSPPGPYHTYVECGAHKQMSQVCLTLFTDKWSQERESETMWKLIKFTKLLLFKDSEQKYFLIQVVYMEFNFLNAVIKAETLNYFNFQASQDLCAYSNSICDKLEKNISILIFRKQKSYLIFCVL